MRTNAAIAAARLAGLAALACAGSVLAHHTHLLYQTTPIWISGTVTSFELKNPHAITTLEDRSAEEIARDSRLPSGTRLTPAQLASTPDGASPRLVLGHMLVTTGGAMRVWEPYGLISECMRGSNDQRQSWIELLNANPEARKFWCDQRAAVQSNASLKEFVDETTNLLAEPCK